MIFNNKRSEVELTHELLSSVDEDINKTRLRYKVYMEYIQFNKYLEKLIEKNLIIKKEKDQEGIIYHITDEGMRLLESLDEVLTCLK